jgi:hypothetical protein
MAEPILMFTPLAMAQCLALMTDEQASEMDAYADQGEPLEYAARCTEWLLAHGFSGHAVLVLPDGLPL